MLYKKKHPLIAFLTVFVFFAVIILNFSDGFSIISIKTATPFIILPVLCAYSLFSDIKRAAFAGFITGACADSVTSGSYCFNTIALLIIGVGVCLAANNLFNKNIRAAAVLSLIVSVLYFGADWLIFHAIGFNMQHSLEFLFSFSLASAIYTSVFVIPFYFLFKHFDKVKNQH